MTTLSQAELFAATRDRLADYSAQRMADDLLDGCADLASVEDCASLLLLRGHDVRQIGNLIDRAIALARERRG